MTAENNPHPVEHFLPPADANLTLRSLLDGYGNYWMSQPSLSPYKRYYSASDKEFMVWEGYPGSYDSYGDFADDDAFFNEVVKAYELFWNLEQNANGSVRVWGIDNAKLEELPLNQQQQVGMDAFAFKDKFGVSFKYTCPSLIDVRETMITRWTAMKPTLGDQGKAGREFMAQHRQTVVGLLNEFGQLWVNENNHKTCHYRVYPIENFVYIACWTGEREAVENPPDYDPKQQGHPIINWSLLETCSVFRVAFKRLPVRFSLEEPYWKIRSIDYGYIENADALKKLNDLSQSLDRQLSNMKFFHPAAKTHKKRNSPD